VAMLYDNTTIQGSWINVQNMADLSTQYNRIVNNVSMALPHSGVFAAARDPINNIVQPEDLDVSHPRGTSQQQLFADSILGPRRIRRASVGPVARH